RHDCRAEEGRPRRAAIGAESAVRERCVRPRLRPREGAYHVEWRHARARGKRGYPAAVPGRLRLRAGSAQAALRCAGGGSCLRQRSIQSAVSFSCTPFCARRCDSALKSTWSSGWSWLKQEKTYVVLPVAGSTCGCRHCAQISFIMHCIGELMEPIALCFGLRKGLSSAWRAWATGAFIRCESVAMTRSAA